MSGQHIWVENNAKTGDDLLWDKEAEPELQGKLSKIEHNIGPNLSTMYTVTKDDGTEVKLWGSTVLDDRFLGIIQNTYVKISYEGLVKGKNGKSYNNYKVFIDEDSVPSGSSATDIPLGGAVDDNESLKDLFPE